ncbi:uncharacterized protein LOC112490647 [Ziziphus jujuba]|uniref:Uncharacterized protein LOC112490647 n=1 Tax=Ziziphus jujuba TaxID=326968 RepID=A0A6P6FXT5_ZIZJJ|nr:uncharacterized protein LOC112490647 [Ziziphus jujuba]
MVEELGHNEFYGGFNGFSPEKQQFHNPLYDSVKPESFSVTDIHKGANELIRQTPRDPDQVNMANLLLNLPPLGLALHQTPALLETIQSQVFPQASDVEKEKLKAVNFGASLLRIGLWQRITRNEGDLVAKCYYAKRKLVWEILEKGLKSKIEIQWSDVVGMRAILEENRPGILEIELSIPPTFYKESDPQPRKHTLWNASPDFTDGQALIYRRHYLEFPSGVLDKHYEKLLQRENRFYQLSKSPFPRLESPFFSQIREYPFGFNGNLQEINSALPLPNYHQVITKNLPPAFPTPQFYEPNNQPHMNIYSSTSPTSVMGFASPLDDVISSSHGVENSSMVIWGGQGMNAFPDHAVETDQIQRLQQQQQLSLHQPKQEYPMVSNQNYNNLITYQGGGSQNPEGQVLSNIENELLNESQVECTGSSEFNHDHHVNWAQPSQIPSIGERIPLYPPFPINPIHKESKNWEGAQISDAEVWDLSDMNVNFPNLPHFG